MIKFWKGMLLIVVFQRESSSEEKHHDFITVTNTSPVTTEMDTRADE